MLQHLLFPYSISSTLKSPNFTICVCMPSQIHITAWLLECYQCTAMHQKPKLVLDKSHALRFYHIHQQPSSSSYSGVARLRDTRERPSRLRRLPSRSPRLTGHPLSSAARSSEPHLSPACSASVISADVSLSCFGTHTILLWNVVVSAVQRRIDVPKEAALYGCDCQKGIWS